MTSFIKGGVVTRIDVVGRESDLNKYFDLNFYTKDKKSYILKEEILNKNIINFRCELMELTNYNGDSIDESDAYVLLTTGDKLLKKDIKISSDGNHYSYEGYNNIFETMLAYETLGKNKLRIYFIPILWIVDKLWYEDEKTLKLLLNNMIKKSLTNKLKNAFFITFLN